MCVSAWERAIASTCLRVERRQRPLDGVHASLQQAESAAHAQNVVETTLDACGREGGGDYSSRGREGVCWRAGGA